MTRLSKIDITFEFGLSNGSMTLNISEPYRHIKLLHNIKSPIVNMSFDVEFPTVLVFDISNKDPNHDTVVDSQGNIVSDKFVKVKSIRVGNVPVGEGLLFNMCKYFPEFRKESVNDTFWAFNGRAVVEFSADNFIHWHLAQNNFFHV